MATDETSDLLTPKRRLCFCIPYTPSSTTSWYHRDDAWWTPGVVAIKKLREWSEIVAGPKWKTFIRRFGRSRSGGGSGRSAKFQYDPLSYALNFDEGGREGDVDEEFGFRNFSCRYAAVPMAAVKGETAVLT